MPITAQITAVGGYVPDYVLTNRELETLVDTSDEWIRERTGIEERRLLKGENQGSSVMAIAAVQRLLAQRGLDPQDIDLVLCATVTPDHPFPATANLIATAIGAKRAWGYDVEAACSGFLYALASGAQFIETGRCRCVLVVGVDKMSSIIDYADRNTCVIFGDGAGAVLLEPSTEGRGIRSFVHYSDGAGCAHLHQPAGGSRLPASEETVLRRQHFVYQEGKQVFKFAVTNMAEVTVELMQKAGLTARDVDWLVPHQANLRIIEATRERIQLPREKVMLNIQRYGNTTSGTIPLCLWDYRDQLKPGQNLVITVFGGGFTWGAMHVVW